MQWVEKKLSPCQICKNTLGRNHQFFVQWEDDHNDEFCYTDSNYIVCYWCYKILEMEYFQVVSDFIIKDILDSIEYPEEFENTKYRLSSKKYYVTEEHFKIFTRYITVKDNIPVCNDGKHPIGCGSIVKTRMTTAFNFLSHRENYINNVLTKAQKSEEINTFKLLYLDNNSFINWLPLDLINVIILFLQ